MQEISSSTLSEKMMITLKNHHKCTMLSAKNLFIYNLAAIQHTGFFCGIAVLGPVHLAYYLPFNMFKSWYTFVLSSLKSHDSA